MTASERLDSLVRVLAAARIQFAGGDEDGARDMAFNHGIPLLIAYVTDGDPDDFLVYEVCDSPIFPTPEVEA